jgi:hypothetical protein
MNVRDVRDTAGQGLFSGLRPTTCTDPTPICDQQVARRVKLLVAAKEEGRPKAALNSDSSKRLLGESLLVGWFDVGGMVQFPAFVGRRERVGAVAQGVSGRA